MVSKFSISISYPPIFKDNRNALLSQNRQFQWTNTGNLIYPVIPASAATLLSENNYQVYWDDAIAQKLTYQQWLDRLIKIKPNLIVIETKTPVVKTHWQIISDIKKESLKIKNYKLKIVLMGDHVTALPEESLNKSLVDFVLTGGDYDFMLLNLANHLSKNTKLEPGFWYKKNNKIINSGKFALKHHNLDSLPIIDRQLTQWQLYAFNNSNYKYKPGAYIMSGRDCWWGRCAFCSWTTLFPGSAFRSFSVNHTIKEIENLVNNFGVREIFDDSGTLPVGPWLEELCTKLINRGLNKKVKFSCNMRFGALNQKQYLLLAKAGFRFILYGLESSNQKTLKKINKNLKTSDARNSLIMAKKAGLEPHITVMIGYPWETLKDATNTLNNAKNLFRDGLVDSLQATIIIPYPGTPLFDYCQKNNLLMSSDWNDYDMHRPIMKSPIDAVTQLKLINSLFKVAWEPKFLFRKVISIRSLDDIKYLSTYAIKFIKKLYDFKT